MSEQQQRLTAEELREIAERCEKATEGPWKYLEFDNVVICNCNLVPVVAEEFSMTTDGEFIAASRTDIPRLLAHIAVLESFIHSVANPDFSKYDGWEGVVRGKQREAEEVLSE